MLDLFNKRSVRCVSIGGNDGVALRDTIDLCGKLSFSQGIAVIKKVAWQLWSELQQDFDEQYYFGTRQDVANAVRAGQFSSGWEHCSRFGKREKKASTSPCHERHGHPVRHGDEILG